jgi:F-type H+-transporting ATPase subunit epsilon
MAEKMKLEIVTPYAKVVDTEVDEVTATGALGEFGVLPDHAPFLTSLKIGELCYKADGVSACMALNWGYFEIKENRIIVLVETAEHAHEIDVERARAAQARAEEALRKLKPEDKQFKIYEAAIERALIRMQVAGKAVRK